MVQPRRTDSVKLPAARLLGVVRRRRAALMVSTALQAGCALVLGFPAQAQPAPNARPTGGQVVAGTASISQAPSVTTVTQATQRAAVNWQSFDVGARQTVQFAQPSASATTLNRVTGPNPSQIAGRIDANGQVILVNQDGVTFYKGAQVNATGLVVSAAGISNQNFMAGRMVFDQPAADGARVENRGNITVRQAGLAALVAPQVANSGVITARLGHVVLAGARAATLDLYGDGLVSIDVTQQVTKVPLGPDGKPVTALVTNTGTVLADGGTVRLTAQAVDGIVQNLVTAGGRISAASVGHSTGEIVIDGIGGSIAIAGQLSTQGVAAGTKGGRIEAVADGGVTLSPTAVLDASGRSGGGTVAVGTTLARAKGGPSVTARLTAASVAVDAGARIAADATEHGDGGRVAVLSTGSTEMDGAISAKGGPLGGDGGFVETSGQILGLTGEIDVSAPIGSVGTILLDPGTLDITHATSSTGSLDGSFNNGTLGSGVGGAAGSVTDFKINQLGAASDLVLQATTLLDVQTATRINVTHGLTLQSGNTLSVETGVSIQAGTTLLLGSGIVFPAGTVGVGAAGTISLAATDTLTAPNIILQGGSNGITLNTALLSATSTLDISAIGGGVSQAAGGTISAPLLTSKSGIVGPVSLAGTSNAIGALGTVQVTGGNLALTDTGNLSVAGTVAAGNVTLTTADTAATPHAFIGVPGTLQATAATGADVLVSGSGGIALTGTLTTGPTGTVDLSTTGSAITEVASGQINTGTLQSSSGIVGTANLIAGANAISVLGAITVTGGNFDLADASPLTVNTPVVVGGGNILLQEGSGSALTLSNALTAASTGTISLVADALTVNAPGTIAAAGGGAVKLVELAPASPISVGLGGGAVLSLGGGTLGAVKTATLRVGAFTELGGALDVTASSISFGGMLDLRTNAIATALDLQANGAINQGAKFVLSVGTLTGSTNGVAASSFLMNAGNTIDAVGSISATGGNFLLNDTVALTVTGAVRAGAPAAPNAANTASLTLTTGGALALGAGALSGTLNAGTVVLTAQNTISEPNGMIGANTLTASSALGSVLLTRGLDQIGTIAGLSAAGSIQAISDPAVLTLTGTATGSTLLFENPAVGGTIALNAATLTSTGATPLVSLVADHLTQATSTIAATAAGVVQLAPATVGTDVVVGGAGDTLGAVLSAITPAVGTLVIGQFTGTDAVGTISAHNITFAAPLNLGPLAGTLVLDSKNGAVTQGGADSLLNLGTLMGTAGSFGLLAGANQINFISRLTASAAGGVGVMDGNALSVTGNVSAPLGQVFLQSSNAGGVTLAAGGTLTGGTLDSIQANAFTISPGGTIPVGPTFELAPATPGETMTLGGVGPSLSLINLNSISPATLRLGEVTLPGGGTTVTAGSIVVAGAFGTAAVSLELDSTSGISQTALLTASTLSGTAGAGAAALGLGNSIVTLGAFSAQGFTLNDTIPLMVTGAVTGGPTASITDSGNLLTVAGTGSVTANAVSLNAGSIDIAGLVSDGGAGSTTLVATGSFSDAGPTPGTINETGTLISGTLSGSATGTAGLLGATPTTNRIADLGPFSADGLTVDDGIGLTVVAAVAGGPSATIIDTGLLTVSGAGSVTATAVSLTGTAIAIAGMVTDGGAGTTSLVATAGSINETGTLISGTLSGSATGTASLLGATPTTNQITDLGPFSANGLSLDDGIGLTVVAAVTGGPSAVITDAGSLTITGAGSVTATGSAVSLTGTSLTIAGLVSDGGAGTTSLIATAGTIDETGTLISGTLSGSATATANLLGTTPTTNRIADIGPFSASGLTLDDGIGLTVGAAVAGGPSATITDAALLTVAGAGSVIANAVSLTGTSITIAGLVSDGGAGTTSLVATGGIGDNGPTPGTIAETGTLISGVLSGSATGAASLLGATPTTNQITDLGPFSAVRLTVDDGIGLTVGAAVSGGPSAAITDAALLTVAPAGSVTANALSLTGSAIAIAGLVSDGGAGTTALIATSGTIDETGTLMSGTLSGSATAAANLLGATPTTNRITDLGPFSAGGLTVDDGIALTVGAAVAGGPSASITDAGLLNVAGAGSVTAAAIDLNAGSIAIAGLVSDGGAGTTTLVATGGTINESGILISGALSGSATGVASLLGTTPATNRIADLGPFSASGLTVDDGIGLTVGAAVTGRPSASITDIGLLNVSAAGSVTANAVNLTAASISIAGLVSDGGAGTTSLIASAGPIGETGTLISGTLSGSATGAASLFGATPTTNRIADLGRFSASGLSVDDGIGLAVAAAVTGGPSAAITDAAALTIAAAGSVTAQAVSLTATAITIGGLVSDGGAGTTSLIASAGAIDETGTLVSGTLSGSATGSASLLGATPTTNRIADLGPFSASGLTLDDGTALTVGAAVAGGPSAAITDAALLTIAATGSVTANATSLIGTDITIAGLVADSGTGTTSLIANAGAINETGTLISGTLSGSATGAASLPGATPTTNQIADLGPFTATGLTLNDGASLLIGAAVAGGPSAVITDAGLLTVASSVTATAINLTAGTLAIPGLVSDGGAGTTQLVATVGNITETGALISGTLGGAAAGTATLTGTNTIVALGAFSTGQALTLADTRALTVNGPIAAGTAAQFSAAALTVPGVITAGTDLTLLSSGTIAETGQLVTPVLTGSAPGTVQLLGATNRIAEINSFSAGGLTLNNVANLLLNGTLTSPLIVINDGGFQITLGNNTALVTGGITRPAGRISTPPPTSDGGAFLTGAFKQVGNSFVTGLGGGPTILVLTAGSGQNIAFDQAGGLHALGTWLVLDVAAGDQISGNVFVKALDVFHTGLGGNANLAGTINGISGVPAAGAGNIAPSTSADFRFNNCPISSVNCVLLPVEGIPVGNPLNDFTLDAIANANDEDELLLPLNANDQDELLPPIVSHEDE